MLLLKVKPFQLIRTQNSVCVYISIYLFIYFTRKMISSCSFQQVLQFITLGTWYGTNPNSAYQLKGRKALGKMYKKNNETVWTLRDWERVPLLKIGSILRAERA